MLPLKMLSPGHLAKGCLLGNQLEAVHSFQYRRATLAKRPGCSCRRRPRHRDRAYQPPAIDRDIGVMAGANAKAKSQGKSHTFRMTKVQAKAMQLLREAPESVGALYRRAEAILPVGRARAQQPDSQRMYEPGHFSFATFRQMLAAVPLSAVCKCDDGSFYRLAILPFPRLARIGTGVDVRPYKCAAAEI